MMRDRRSAFGALCAAIVLIGAGCRGRASEARNLVVVTVDTLRADKLGAYGDDGGLTPSIDRLAARADVYTSAWAPAPFTLASIAGLMTGHHPAALGIENNMSMVPPDVPTLAGLLRARGWRTGAIVGSFVLRRESGIATGFDEFDDAYPGREAHRDVPERQAPDTAAAALRMLARLASRGSAPFFMWVHFQDPHGPYVPPEAERERCLVQERRAPDADRLLPVAADDRGLGAIPRYQFAEGHFDAAWYRAGYDGEIRYMDEHLGRLLAALDDRSVVVFAADHGEGLGEDGYWFAHGEYLSDALVRVPLIIRVPGRAPSRHAATASLLDVLPTLARVLGVRVDGTLRGRDLFADGASEVYMATLRESTLPRVGFVSGGYRYVVAREADGPHEALFALGRDGSTPARSTPETLGEMRNALAALEAREASRATPRRQRLGREDRARLGALGYAGD
jgi:arylsulfatase A-like enzyme